MGWFVALIAALLSLALVAWPLSVILAIAVMIVAVVVLIRRPA